MRQPLETDGLQTACHVYCCSHKRQKSNNTIPQETHRTALGPYKQLPVQGDWSHTFTHMLTPSTLTMTKMPLLPNNIHTYKTSKKRQATHSKCPPTSRPDMLHLLQLNKHAIWISDDTLQPAPWALNIMVSPRSPREIVHVTLNEENLHCYLN